MKTSPSAKTNKPATVDAYVRKHSMQWAALARQLRILVKKEIPGVKEYINP